MTDREPTVAATITVQPEGGAPPESLLVAFTRMETKVDVVLGAHGSQLSDHETRLRAVEEKKTISPWQLWTALASAATVLVAVLAIFDRINLA